MTLPSVAANALNASKFVIENHFAMPSYLLLIQHPRTNSINTIRNLGDSHHRKVSFGLPTNIDQLMKMILVTMLIEARQNNKVGKENIAVRIVILVVIHAVDQGK